MDSEIVFLHFESSADAERAMGTINSLGAEGFIQLEDAAIATRGEDGLVSVKAVDHAGLKKKAALGGVLGAIAGALVGLPVVGAAAGAGVAAKKALGNEHLDEILNTVGRSMTPGTAVLALTVASLKDPGSVTDGLEIHRDKLIRAEIPASLRAQLDEESGAG